MKKLLLCAALLLPGTLFAKSIDLNFTDDSVRFTYAHAIDRNLVTDLGVLFLENEGRFQDDELAFHAGLNVVSGSVRFGGRAFFVAPGDIEALAIGLGGQARFALSRYVGLGGHFYYAPEAISFIDAEGYYEYSIRLDFKVTRSAYLYLGYRNVTVRIGDRDNKVELDDDAMLGFKLYF